MTLPANYAKIFKRDCFTFKQLKEQLSTEEIEQIKIEYKTVWQAWKE
ncbi:MAG: HI_0552 family protein, partial [Enterococcus lemanii]